ncbi:hypothetical protein PO903_07840 [Paenibacillus sp. PK4536]|jgi:hypothetical protein|uniref:hypothetical protein n=1 Tax=Paenibacillus TaxID=44249 RepID=UPI0023594327|nr:MULTISPECIES: hypothetical protein [Paenibacillus]WIM40775.1 hypothetical protein PO903_07840 [Paenibacillus sp. PK4536]CAJ1316871.1 Ubiquitinyl hydrolase 1 [Paenibacillus nuruki]
MECIVKFDVIHDHEVKALRGLVFVEDGKAPTTEQLEEMFKDMKYEVTADRGDSLRFMPTQSPAPFHHIRIKELDTGDKKFTEDRDLKGILSNLLPTSNRPI